MINVVYLFLFLIFLVIIEKVFYKFNIKFFKITPEQWNIIPYWILFVLFALFVYLN